jgi:tetratricopeptide (TPR) repeat protein
MFAARLPTPAFDKILAFIFSAISLCSVILRCWSAWVVRMRLMPVFLMLTLAAAFGGVGHAQSSDVQSCLSSDRYHASQKTYELCTKALEDSALAKAEKAKVLIARGEAMYFAGQMPFSINDLDEALRLDPGNDEGHLRRAWTRMRLQQIPGARDDLTLVLAKQPDNTDINFALAFTYADTNEWTTTGKALLHRVLEINPDHYLARFNLANMLLLHENRADLAVPEYDRILAASDDALSKVKIWNEPGFAHYDFRGDVRMWRVSAKMTLNEEEGLLAEINALADKYPDVPNAFIARGRYYKNRGDWARSLTDAETAIRLNPYNSLQRADQLTALYYLRQYDKGLTAANDYLNRRMPEPALATIYFLRAFFNKHTGHAEEAMIDFETAFSLDPVTLKMALTQVMQSGYYTGDVSDPYSPVIRNGLLACIADPKCGG